MRFSVPPVPAIDDGPGSAPHAEIGVGKSILPDVGFLSGSLLSQISVLFPYSTPTPPDALEIVRLSGRGIV